MAGDVVTTGSEAPLLRDDYRGSRSPKAHHHPKHGGAMQHTHSGRVTSIDQHHTNSKHATITVRHGKQKRDKTNGELNPYSQAETRMTIPKAHAKNYTLGQRVNVGISPSTDAGAPGEDENSNAGEVNEKATPPFKAGASTGTAKKGKKTAARKSVAKSAAKTKKAPSAIQQAMTGRR